MQLPRIVKKDFQVVLRSKIKLLSMLVVVFMPLAYGFLYLWASWDPYANMDNVPVAIVNEDQGVVFEGQKETFGQELLDNITKEKVADWQEVDMTEARAGLENQKYYAYVLIPRDFSEKSISAESDKPESAIIVWQTKDSTSYLFTKYFEVVMKEVVKNVNAEMAGRFQIEAEKIAGDLTASLDEASVGASDLASGLNSLENGSEVLSENLEKAESGASSLTGGLNELNDKSGDLLEGASKVKEGSSDLNFGLKTANSGTKKLSSGLSDLESGANALKNATDQAYQGASELSEGTSRMNDKFASVDQNLSVYYPALNYLGQQIDDLNASTEILLPVPNYISEAREKKEELFDGQNKIANGAEALADGTQQLDGGADTLVEGIASAKVGVNDLSDGMDELYSGSSDLSEGAQDLYDGSLKFSDGVAQAQVGGSELADGITQLADGAKQFSSGLNTARSGADTLSTELATGATEIKKELGVNRINDLVQVINQPVILANASVDTNQNYGSALAPYFISLALWMGALMMTLLLPTRDTKLIVNNVPKFTITWQRAVLPLTLGVLQAGALLFPVIIGLGLEAEHLFLFILFCILTSFCFIAIMQFISYRLGKIGEFLGIMIMLVQLTSSSGTFPVQSAPRIFQILNPISPMNYSIKGMRLLILGGPMDMIIISALVLVGITMLFVFLKSLRTSKTILASELYPLIEL